MEHRKSPPQVPGNAFGKAWQEPHVNQEPRSRKGWLGRFLVSPGVMGDFWGRSANSVWTVRGVPWTMA